MSSKTYTKHYIQHLIKVVEHFPKFVSLIEPNINIMYISLVDGYCNKKIVSTIESIESILMRLNRRHNSTHSNGNIKKHIIENLYSLCNYDLYMMLIYRKPKVLTYKVNDYASVFELPVLIRFEQDFIEFRNFCNWKRDIKCQKKNLV